MLGSEFFLGLNFWNQKYNEGITKWFPLTNDDVNVIFPKQFPSNGDSQAFANGDALNNVFWVIKAGWGWEDNYLENYRVIDQLFSNDPSSGAPAQHLAPRLSSSWFLEFELLFISRSEYKQMFLEFLYLYVWKKSNDSNWVVIKNGPQIFSRKMYIKMWYAVNGKFPFGP